MLVVGGRRDLLLPLLPQLLAQLPIPSQPDAMAGMT